MSDYNDVLYNPRTHTHTSCIEEVAGVDVLLLIVGSRFGGSVVPQALQQVDLDALDQVSKSVTLLKTRESLSITQLEVLKAIEESIPIFAFINSRVMNDHATYERNKVKGIAAQIEYASIEKPETATFIFEFINFLRMRLVNNAVITFSRPQDIEESLKRQWSGLLQRLLLEQRSVQSESRRIDALTNQFEDLKAAILAAVGGSKNEKDIARGVVRFRRLLDFVRALGFPDASMLTGPPISWDNFLQSIGIAEVIRISDQGERNPGKRGGFLLERTDGQIYEVDGMFDLTDLSHDWAAFMKMPQESRTVVQETLDEVRSPSSYLARYVRLRPALETVEPSQETTQRKASPLNLEDEIPF